MSPTPLERHRSREPSPFLMPRLKLGSGTITPGGSKPADPHTYFSRSSSSQSLHQAGYGGSQTFQGGIGTSNLDFDSFRAAMEAKQAEDEIVAPATSSLATSHTQSMTNISSWKSSTAPASRDTDHLCPGGMFSLERPSSAMSEVSIHMDHDLPSRADSRMETFPLGDAISHGHLAYTEDQQSNFSSRRGSQLQTWAVSSKTSAAPSWQDNESSLASDVTSVVKIDSKDSKNTTSLQVAGDNNTEKFSTASALPKNQSNFWFR